MAALISLKEIIPKIIQSVSFEDYLLHNGYIRKDKNLEGFTCYQKDFGHTEDTVLISNIDGVEHFYSLSYRDKGNIIDFVKNRIEIENDYNTFEPLRDHITEACKKIVSFINESGESIKSTGDGTNKEELQSFIKNSFTLFYKAKQINEFENIEYCNYLGINSKVLENEIFDQKVFLTIGLRLNDKLYSDSLNMSFPIYDELNNECGLYNSTLIDVNGKKEEISFYVPGSNKTGIWISNRADVHKNNKTKITVVDKPTEAFAHFAYFNEERQYISIFENNETTNEIIKNVLKKSNCSLHLSLSVSLENIEKELRIILSLIEGNVRIIKSSYDVIQLKIDASEEEKFLDLIKRIKVLNTNNVAKSIKLLGDSAKPYMASSLILASPDEKDNLILTIPKNIKTIYQIDKLLLKVFTPKFQVFIEKPKYNDWKTQNAKGIKQLNYEEKIERKELYVLKQT